MSGENGTMSFISVFFYFEGIPNQTKCDGEYDDEEYGRLVYNSDLVHTDKEVKIMRVTVEIPETYTKSAKEHIFNMLKNHGAIDIDGLNLSDVRNHFSNVNFIGIFTTPG